MTKALILCKLIISICSFTLFLRVSLFFALEVAMQEFIRLDFDTPAHFSLSSLGAGQEAVFDLSVTNLSETDELPLTVEVSSEPAFFAPQVISLGVLAPNTKRIFPDLKLSYDRTLLSYSQENVTSQISVRVISGGEEVAAHSRACDVLRHDAWGGVHFLPELLSCLISPQQSQVQDVVRTCRQRLQRNKIRLEADGYQSSMNRDYVRAVSRAVFSAVYDVVRSCGIIFSIQQPELSRRGATVQLPETTLAKKSANALDAALLYASCLESLSMNPVILLSGSKVFIGGFLESRSFVSPLVDHLEMVKTALLDGSLCLFEASDLAKGTSVGFSTACQLGEKATLDLADFYLLLDVRACREQGIKPLDNRVMYEDGIHFEKPGLTDEDDVFSNDTAIEEASPDSFNQNLRDVRRFLCDFSPYNPLLCHPEEDRVRVLITEPDRFYPLLGQDQSCPLFSALDAPFGYRMEETQAAIRLDAMDKRAASLSEVDGEVCLAFGLVKWAMKDAQGEAPLFLMPLRLNRSRGRLSSFSSLVYRPKINVSLLAFLTEFFALDLAGLRDISAGDAGEYLKKALFYARSEFSGHTALTFVEQEVFFALLKTTANDKLSALAGGRVESHSLAKSICAGEKMQMPELSLSQIADPAPVSVPTPYPLNRDALRVVAAAQKQDYTLVKTPAGGGKTRLGVALAFSALNHSENSVLYITGERANPRDVLRVFQKAGIDDLVAPLSVLSPQEADYRMRETNAMASEEYYLLSTEFSDEQKTLLSYESILSERLLCGITPEEAIYCFDHVRGARDCLHFSPETVGRMDENTVNNHQQVIRNLTLALTSIGSPVGHPLRYVKTRGFSYEIKAEAVRLLDEYSKKFKEYITFLRGSCAGLFPRARIHNEMHEKAFLNLLHMMGEGRGINPCYFEREIAASDLAKAETIFAYGRECCEMRLGVLSNLSALAFDLPVKELIISWRDADLKRGGARKKIHREITQKLAACCKERRDIDVLDTLYQIEKYHNYRAYLFENAVLIQRLFGVDILAPQNDTPEIWTRLAALCRDCVTIDRQFSSLAGEARADAAGMMRNFTQEDASRASSLCEGILELRAEMEKIRDRFLRYLEFDDKAFRSEHQETLYDEIPKLLKELSGGMESFQQWTEWLNSADVARATGFEQVLDAVDAGLLSGENLEDAYARAFFSALCEFVFLKYPVLTKLRGGAFEEKLLHLNEKRERIYKLAQGDIRSKHLRRYMGFAQESGLDLSKRFLLTPGAFSADTYTVTCRYPILVANADDAVRFLEGTPARFGLLILDDAQTLSMPSALALIPRAEKTVILGTPTPRQSSCVLSDAADRFLKRSREEVPAFWSSACSALDAFELRFSYQRMAGLLNLVSTASANAPAAIPFAARSGGVREIRTPGHYDPVTFVNLPEVMQTVEEILSILRAHHKEGRVLSLGVCATTEMQKFSILQSLAKRLREEPELYSVLRDANESFYVCSLSDEPIGRRDVILWSMTVAPEKESHVPLRSFPLLSDRNGARKILSVLSGARKELCVLHSVHSDSIDLLRMCTGAQSALRRVCKEAFSKPLDVRAVTDGPATYDNPIAERIAAFLREKGCETGFCVRSGSFGLDLVARLPKQPDFALAVLLDETVFSVCSGHVLGEVRLMQHLRECGYSPIHVHATDWFENDQAVLDSIAALLPDKKKNNA